METIQIVWLLIAYSVGTLVGWWFTYKFKTQRAIEQTIDCLIQEGCLKTKGEGRNMTIMKWSEQDVETNSKNYE